MKKYSLYIILLLCLFPIKSYAFNPLISCPGAVGGCSTPSLGSYLTEGFEGTGYENTWSETSTPNEDYSLPGTPPSGACSQGMFVSVVSGVEIYSMHDHGSSIDIDSSSLDVIFYVYIDSGLDAGEAINICHVGNSATIGSDKTAYVIYDNNSGTHRLWAYGASGSSVTAVSLDTWYKITLHLDTTAASSYIQIDSGSQYTFTRAAYDARYFFIGANAVATGEDAEIVFDLFYY